MSTAPDQRVILNGIDWWQFEAFLAIRGDRAGARVTYVDEQLEIMIPSRSHEMLKTMIARLLYVYAEERGLVFEGYGSMTMRNAPKLRGIEPDECYAVGAAKESPDLAVEVVWTHGGIDKLDVYRGLGVREVWIWKKEELKAYQLRGGAYVEIAQSVVIPGLAPSFIREFLDYETQTEAGGRQRLVARLLGPEPQDHGHRLIDERGGSDPGATPRGACAVSAGSDVFGVSPRPL